MKVIITSDYEEMSLMAAKEIAELIQAKPNCVLGLATGSTPEGMYRKLVELNKLNKVNFSKVTSFNLDEYRGLKGTHPQSYRYFMDSNLFNHINIKKENTFIPSGTAVDIDEECRAYDEKINDYGGIDLQILGIGNNGHIGFNEPSDSLSINTHLTKLSEDTIKANSRFFDAVEEVPTEALTMGLGGIMKAKKILLLASGSSKAEIIKKLVDGNISTEIPASLLQVHNNVLVIVDEAAGALLKHVNEEYVEIIK